MVVVDRFLAYVDINWRMFQKRGLTCEMVKMWMTRESSDCFLLSLFYVAAQYLGSSASFSFRGTIHNWGSKY